MFKAAVMILPLVYNTEAQYLTLGSMLPLSMMPILPPITEDLNTQEDPRGVLHHVTLHRTYRLILDQCISSVVWLHRETLEHISGSGLIMYSTL